MNVVSHRDLIIATKPLLDLLGVDATEVFTELPLTIGNTVSFVATPNVADRFDPSCVEAAVVGQETDAAETAVRIILPLDINAGFSA